MVVVDLPSPRGVGVIPATTMYFPSLLMIRSQLYTSQGE